MTKIQELRQLANTIKTETKVGGNTADRVGSAFEGVADALEGTEQIAEMDKAVQEVQQQVDASKAQIQSLVNALPVVQQTGDSTTSVMSQKAVTDELGKEVARAQEAERVLSQRIDAEKAVVSSMHDFPELKVQKTISGMATIFHYTLGKNVVGKLRIIGSASKPFTLYGQVYPDNHIVSSKYYTEGVFDITIDLTETFSSNEYVLSDGFEYIKISANSTSKWDNDTFDISEVYLSNNLYNYYNNLNRQNQLDTKQNQLEDNFSRIMQSKYEETNGCTMEGRSAFPSPLHDNIYVMTTKNSAASEEGILKSIKVNALKDGVAKFAVAFLDQRNWMVDAKVFNLDVKAGTNEYFVGKLGIKVQAGYQLFAWVNPYIDDGSGLTGSKIPYLRAQSQEDIEHEIIYGKDNSELVRLNTPNGGRTYMTYTINTFDSIFALKSENEALTEKVERQAKEIRRLNFVYDAEGTPYKISVVDGSISLKRQYFRNIFCIGNSLTKHFIAPQIGYYGNSWPMAATSEKMGWCALVGRIFGQKQDNVEVHTANIASMERNPSNYLTDSAVASLLGNGISDNTDLVIYKGGENNNSTSDYVKGVDYMIGYIVKHYPKATILMTTSFWPSPVKEHAHEYVATKYNLNLLDIGTEIGKTKEMLGDFTVGGNGDEYEIKEYPIVHSGVAGHVADYGFYKLANKIASFYGYEELNEVHDIKITSSVDYKILRTKGVYQGLISILVKESNAPTISIIDNDGNEISSTCHDMSSVIWMNEPTYKPTFVFTFVMPNSDVNVTIE